MKYVARLARENLPQLNAVLQFSGPHNEDLPWVTMMKSDIIKLHSSAAVASKLAKLGDPREDIQPFWNFARGFPKAWHDIVDKYHDVDDDDVHASTCTTGGASSNIAGEAV